MVFTSCTSDLFLGIVSLRYLSQLWGNMSIFCPFPPQNCEKQSSLTWATYTRPARWLTATPNTCPVKYSGFLGQEMSSLYSARPETLNSLWDLDATLAWEQTTSQIISRHIKPSFTEPIITQWPRYYRGHCGNIMHFTYVLLHSYGIQQFFRSTNKKYQIYHGTGLDLP